MPTISEPTLDIRNAQYHRIRWWFIMGHVGEATFEASLRILGLRNQQEIAAEIALAKMERRAEAKANF